MAATVHSAGLLSAAGNTTIPFTVQGTCSDPVFRPDMKAVAKETVKSSGRQPRQERRRPAERVAGRQEAVSRLILTSRP